MTDGEKGSWRGRHETELWASELEDKSGRCGEWVRMELERDGDRVYRGEKDGKCVDKR